MAEHVGTIVIGARQAGLATSYHLTRRSREHVVLERGQVADTWRTRRWDGFCLNTPRWTQQLPGHEYRGPEPDAFSSLEEVISYLDEYATSFAAPVRTDAEVSAFARPATASWSRSTARCSMQTTSSSPRARTRSRRRRT